MDIMNSAGATNKRKPSESVSAEKMVKKSVTYSHVIDLADDDESEFNAYADVAASSSASLSMIVEPSSPEFLLKSRTVLSAFGQFPLHSPTSASVHVPKTPTPALKGKEPAETKSFVGLGNKTTSPPNQSAKSNQVVNLNTKSAAASELLPLFPPRSSSTTSNPSTLIRDDQLLSTIQQMQKSLLDSHSFIKQQSKTLDLQQARLVWYDTKIQEQSEMIGYQQKCIDTLSKELEEICTEYAASVIRQSNASGGTASGSTQAGSNILPVPTWADVVSSAQMQQVDAAHQLIIGQLIDSTVANKPGPEPILLAPPQKIGFF
ncbi:hypothetical protein HK100_009839 [Physocladia obscura]|uniref:Uncharacterized protein n=1 Tax=Physocladia obscura TaxID=109957 RepID=A0AAD5SLM1_9FUNG|nr:hypothetical protein HK100_009839 [Physocladia obscura]